MDSVGVLERAEDIQDVVREIMEEILAKKKKAIPQEVLLKTYANTYRAFEEYYVPEKLTRKPCEFAFVVHPRDPVERDVARQWPALSPEYLDWDDVFDIFERFPTTIWSEFTGFSRPTGENIRGYLICVPIIPERVFKFGHNREDAAASLKKARALGLQAADFVFNRLGARVMGLGEGLVALTHFGKDIEELHEGRFVTTGHGNTTYLICETLRLGAQALGIDTRSSTLAVVGGGGSLGSSAALLLAGEVGRFVLCDVLKHDRMVALADQLKDTASKLGNPNLQVEVFSGFDAYLPQLKRADLIISATIAPKPFITKEVVSPGTVIVDDSQPVNAEWIEDSLVLHPIGGYGKHPIDRGFDYGLLPGTDFGCAIESMALAASEKWEDRVVGPVNAEKALAAGRLAREVGFETATLQSFGKYISQDYIERIKKIRGVAPSSV